MEEFKDDLLKGFIDYKDNSKNHKKEILAKKEENKARYGGINKRILQKVHMYFIETLLETEDGQE